MEPRGWMMLQALLNRYHKGSREPLLRHLPQGTVNRFAEFPVEGGDLSPAYADPKILVQKMHYSWLAPLILKASPQMQSLYLSALPEGHRESLKRFLRLSPDLQLLSKPVQEFVLIQLLSLTPLNQHAPEPFLPPSKFNFLLGLGKVQLMELIDFLGLQDLAEALRHIVDKKRLKSIYTFLLPQKQQYLKMCLHQRDRLALPPIELNQWDGSRQQLEKILHRRGLTRLGIALSGQHPELIFHLSQILDTGRGQILQKSFLPKEIKNATPVATIQLQNLIKFLFKQG